MEWRDEGCLLHLQPYGEGHALADVITPEHGRVRALVYGGRGRKLSQILHPGNQFSVRWFARLEDQLGTFTLEPLQSRTALILSDQAYLLAFRALAALVVRYVPEREPLLEIYTALQNVLDAFADGPVWMTHYAVWEMTLLRELGYGLDTTQCAVTGQTTDLTHVSPKSGRAVCAMAAEPYVSRLLVLPDIFHNPTFKTLNQALTLTGHFLRTRITVLSGETALPTARTQLADYVQRQTANHCQMQGLCI